MLNMFRWAALIAAVVLVLAMAGAIFSSQKSVEPSPPQTSENNHKEPDAKKTEIALFDRWFPDSTSVFNLFLMLFTGVLAFGGLYQLNLLTRAERIATDTAKAAKDSADVAKNTLVASQRAWIRAEIGVGDQPLIFYPKGSPTGASVSVSFKVTNIGNSPATNITHHAWLVAMKNGGPFPATEQETRCNEIRQQRLGDGFTLFPNETFPGNIGVGEWSLGIGISPEEIERGLIVGNGKNVALYVVGCVDYTFQTDPSNHHQTGFILELRRKGPFIMRPADGDIPADQLELRESGLGDGRRAD